MKKIINSFLNRLGYKITQVDTEPLYYSNIFQKFKEYTMVPEFSYIENLKLCKQNSHLKGDIVECGTWKGGMISGIAELLGGLNRQYFLFDSFEGLPKAKEIDGKKAIQWQSNTTSRSCHNNCKADKEDAICAMNKAGIDNPKIYKGWFDTTIPNFNSSNSIAFLILDCDWYDSMMICLEYLYPRVKKKGIIIIDDYYVWEGTSKAVHNYLTKIHSVSKIYYLSGGIAYIVKKD